jgi:hypothetical protein
MGYPAHAQSTPEINRSVVGKPSSGQAHLERMKVELAWLADLTCFGHRLEAQVVGSSLEVHGDVPDERTREHAMRVARQNCFLPVVDALRIAAPAVAGKVCSAEQLRQAAVKHLVRAFGQRAAGFDVQASADGKITIGGSVVSVEDKVAISRSLREVAGCTCVLNRLTVTPTTHAGQTVTLVSTDGKHMVRGALPAAITSPNIIQAVSAKPEADEDQLPLPRLSATTPAPAPVAVPAAQTLPSGLPPVRPAYYWNQGAMGQAPVATPYYGAPPCACCAAVGPNDKPPLFPFLARITASRPVPPNYSSAPYSAPAAQTVGYWPPAYGSVPAQPAPITPVSASVPQHGSGQVSAMRLQQLVYNACGGLARKVDISMQGDRSFVVQVQAANAAAERQLVERLMKVPEITTPGVRLEVMVMP